MNAAFRSSCVLCSRVIKVGADITQHPVANVTRWVHSQCARKSIQRNSSTAHQEVVFKPIRYEQLNLF